MRSVLAFSSVLLLLGVGAVLHTQATAVQTTGGGGCCPDPLEPSGSCPIGPPEAAAAEPITVYLMGAAHVAGFNNTSWRTSLEVCNFSGISRSYELGFLHRDQPNLDPETVDLELAPGLCVNYPDVVASVFALDEAVGSLRLVADGDGVVATARTYNDTPDGTYGTALGTHAADQAVVPGENTVLIHLAQSDTDTDGYRTNLDLLNVTELAIDIETALYSSDGTHLGALTTGLEPFEYHQITKAFRSVAGDGVADGYAVVRTATTGGAFLAAASLVDNRTGDSTTIAGVPAPSSERWLEPKNMGPTINTAADDWYPVFARDGSFMIFVSRGHGSYGSGDLFISRFVGGEWQPPENMGPNVNSAGFESAPFLSLDDRTLYFTTNDGGTAGSFDVWSCPLTDGIPGPKANVPGLNTGSTDCCPVLSPDGNTMYICSDRPGGFGSLDVWASQKVGAAWQPPVNLGEVVNSYSIDSPRWISDDGNTIIIDSRRIDGRIGATDLWSVVRSAGEWLAPVNLGVPVNSRWDEQGPGFLGNNGEIGGRIFFGTGRPGGYGGWDIWYSDFGYPVSAVTAKTEETRRSTS